MFRQVQGPFSAPTNPLPTQHPAHPRSVSRLIGRYGASHVDHLRGTIGSAVGYAMGNTQTRPYLDQNGPRGINGDPIGLFVLSNPVCQMEEIRLTPTSTSSIWVQRDTPGAVRQTLLNWLECCNNNMNNGNGSPVHMYEANVMSFRMARIQADMTGDQDWTFTAETEELFSFQYRFYHEYTQLGTPMLTQRMKERWFQHMCGTAPNPSLCVIGNKLELAVIDVLMEECPRIARTRFGFDRTSAVVEIPKPVIKQICMSVKQSLRISHPTLETWWHEDDSISSNCFDYYDWLQGHDIFHWRKGNEALGETNCSFVYPQHAGVYPLSNTDRANLPTPRLSWMTVIHENWLNGKAATHPYVVRKKAVYDQYMADQAGDPRAF